MKKSQRNLSRRQLLGMLGAAGAVSTLDPVQLLIKSLIDGAFSKAQATGSTDPRNYFYLAFPGAFPRYHFDLPLCPFADLNNANYNYPSAALNAGLATKFAGTGTTPQFGTAVVTAPISGIRLRMPHVWGWTIPRPSGVWVPMASLLDHMIFVRGIESLDGHGDSQLIQVRPRAGAPSLDGVLADRSSRAVPALALPGSPDIFQSVKGVGNIRINETSVASNPLAKILSPFDRSGDQLSAGYLSRREAMDVAMKQAVSALGVMANQRTPGASLLWANRSVAEKMVKDGIGNVSTVYSTLHAKYKNLITLCVNEHKNGLAAGITDRDLTIPTSTAHPQYSQFRRSGIGPFNPTLQQLFDSSTTITGLAESFAIAEYLFVNKISNSITAGTSGVSGLQVSGYAPWGWDEHDAGSVIGVVINSLVSRCVAACLFEFIDALKVANVFEDTVIHLGSEFSRAPRADQTGTDHSPEGSAISLVSGAIRRPFVIGNTKWAPASDIQHPGGYGIGNTVAFDGGVRHITASNQASTLAHLLRVNSPSPNDASFLFDQSGTVVPTIEDAKNKESS